jgi:hypothetical protein
MDRDETRQERREERKRKKRDKMLQHGRGFIQAYKNAILKRAKGLGRKGDS